MYNSRSVFIAKRSKQTTSARIVSRVSQWVYPRMQSAQTDSDTAILGVLAEHLGSSSSTLTYYVHSCRSFVSLKTLIVCLVVTDINPWRCTSGRQYLSMRDVWDLNSITPRFYNFRRLRSTLKSFFAIRHFSASTYSLCGAVYHVLGSPTSLALAGCVRLACNFLCSARECDDDI